jgi:outer membrane immunogenic protein
MRKAFLVAALLGAAWTFTTAANAADPAPECADNWSGFYFGGHAGYAFGDSDTVGVVGDADWNGFLGGPLAGYNIQFCNFVLGLEVDAGFGDVDDSVGAITNIDIDMNGHARVRLGLPFDNVMPFVAAGLAIADVDLQVGAASDSHTHLGFSVGGGIDFMATENIVIRAEYLFDDYESKNYAVGGGVSVDGYTHTIRGAIIWKF